jgi:Zn-dependent peptidase ImmA (M78 family)
MVRRGFAAEAERLATAVRGELDLGVHDRLNPRSLATEYGIPVVPLTDLVSEGAAEASVRQLTVVDRGCFSAGTVLVDTNRLIIFNPAHSDGRLANSLTHELAHLLLEHVPGPAIGPGGCRVWDPDMEAEADLLAGVLLVPRDAALACAKVGLPHEIGAARFGVSPPLMRWRTDHTGASRQAGAAARKSGRSIPRPSSTDLAELMRTCDLEWLIELTAKEWRLVLAACGRALSAGSLTDLASRLQPPDPGP